MNLHLAEIQKQIAEHDKAIDHENCPHCCTNGDNYGDSCRHCGKQLRGYGCGGWFGSNLTGAEKCIHDFTDWGEGRICRFCERYETTIKDIEKISQSIH